MSEVDSARSGSIRPAMTVLGLLLVLLLMLRFALKIDVVYVLSGGVPWMLGVEGAVVGFGVGWLLGRRR